jgi:hypothetical protein
MPLALTLPLHFDLGLRARRRRARRILVLALAVAALFAAGMWFPARAALGRAAAPASARVIDARDLELELADLAVGDAFRLRRFDGGLRGYEVIALDVVDSRRVDLTPDPSGRIVTLATPWPFDGPAVSGQWHYVVTGRLRF